MKKEQPRYTVVVPVYNSEDTLEELVNRIEATMGLYEPYELLMVDDFSLDSSWKKLKEVKGKKEHIKLLRLTRNFGQAAATLCGIREAKADIMIIIDDDLQYPPEEIPKLIEAFNPDEKYLLFGVPKEKKISAFQKFNSFLIEGFINKVVFREKKKMRFSSFRIITKKRYNRKEYNESKMRSAQVFFTMVSPQLMDYVYVDHQPRKKGKSTYNLFKKVKIALELLLVTTDMPLNAFLSFTFLFGVLTTGAVLGILAGINLATIQELWFITLSAGFTFTMFGFVLLFGFLKKLLLGHLGAEAYAIWEEA